MSKKVTKTTPSGQKSPKNSPPKAAGKGSKGASDLSAAIRAALVIGALFGLIFLGLWGLGDSFTPLMIAFFLAYLTFPLIIRMEAAGLPRWLAVSGVFTLLVAALVGVLVLVVPSLVAEATLFARELPANLALAAQRLEEWVASLGYDVNLSRENFKETVREHSDKVSGNMVQYAASFLASTVSGVVGMLLAVMNIFLIPLFFFYVVMDFERISKEIRTLIPGPLKGKMTQYYHTSNEVLAGFIRGQLMVALILGILNGSALWALDVRFGFLIGFVGGLVNFIPYVGFFLGLSSALIVALADGGDVVLIGSIIAAYLAIQTLEGFVITPNLVGNKVGLNAFVTILVLIIGGNLFGLPGMLLAIPTAAILKEVLADLKAEYQKTWG